MLQPVWEYCFAVISMSWRANFHRLSEKIKIGKADALVCFLSH